MCLHALSAVGKGMQQLLVSARATAFTGAFPYPFILWCMPSCLLSQLLEVAFLLLWLSFFLGLPILDDAVPFYTSYALLLVHLLLTLVLLRYSLLYSHILAPLAFWDHLY